MKSAISFLFFTHLFLTRDVTKCETYACADLHWWKHQWKHRLFQLQCIKVHTHIKSSSFPPPLLLLNSLLEEQLHPWMWSLWRKGWETCTYRGIRNKKVEGQQHCKIKTRVQLRSQCEEPNEVMINSWFELPVLYSLVLMSGLWLNLCNKSST